MKHYLLSVVLVTLSLFAGCEKKEVVTAVTLSSITRQTFDYKGGLASATVSTGGAAITAESDSEWCRVAVLGQSVNFNVAAFTQTTDRAAIVTVTAEGLTPLIINIEQTRFAGLIVSPTTLIFSTVEVAPLTLDVTASGSYDVELTENPGGAFSFEKTVSGVTFTANIAPGARETRGRAVLTPSEGEAVIVTLIMPEKSLYDKLLGGWSVTNNSDPEGLVVPFVFEINEEQVSYKVYLDQPDLGPSVPFIAEYMDGKVLIQTGQEMGTKIVNGQTKYVSLHFNGTVDGSGSYIFSQARRVAWAATPLFNDENGTVRLAFEDSGQGGASVAVQFNIYYNNDAYFTFNDRAIVRYKNLQLTKYNE
jgi:hypothetical protein